MVVITERHYSRPWLLTILLIQNLETIPRLKDSIDEKSAEILNLKKHMEDKDALLTAARKAVREYKEKLRVGNLY